MFIWLKSYEVVKIIVTVMTYTLCIRNSLSFFSSLVPYFRLQTYKLYYTHRY